MTQTVRLAEIAHARSGDKGSDANVGVIAYTSAGFAYLESVLTEARVAEYFLSLRPRRIVRYALPRIFAYNFVLEGALGGGASRSLWTDNQGKTLGPAILEMPIPRPPNLEEMAQ